MPPHFVVLAKSWLKSLTLTAHITWERERQAMEAMESAGTKVHNYCTIDPSTPRPTIQMLGGVCQCWLALNIILLVGHV